MARITVLSSSIRNERKSQRVASYLERVAKERGHDVDTLDLSTYDFPLFKERLKFLKDPSQSVLDFANRLRASEGLVLVVPEYNGSFPASLKNVIDLLSEDWKGKPISLCTASSGGFAGTQVMMQLLFPLWKLKAWVLPVSMQVPKVQEAFGEAGEVLSDVEGWERRSAALLGELEWAMEARRRMQAAS